ncbi:DUF6366 family protein [Peribacillus sp. NPDC096379]|uniref:DUF6366 family protein n=1 Tax=Peribacillus sp. NPDC096379 TaxID=3364393 RepID=UPI003830A71C
MSQDEQDKIKNKERQKNPMGNLADAVNHSMVGDPGALARGGCLTKILILIIIIAGFFILSHCSS